MRKSNDLDVDAYKQVDSTVNEMKTLFDALDEDEKKRFLGYAQAKLDFSRAMWYSRQSGHIKWKKMEVDAVRSILEEKPWRSL